MRQTHEGQIALALRERLEMAGCYPVHEREDGIEMWFTPHLNREFAMLPHVRSNSDANEVLRRAGMEQAF